MTGISWTDVTWNPVRGCSRVSEGCRHCYAEVQAARIVRMGKGNPTPYDGLVRVSEKTRVHRIDRADGSIDLKKTTETSARWTGKVTFDAFKLAEPLRWKKPRRVFVNSMSDLFHESLTNEQIAAVFGVMAACPQHTFQVLTKRSKRMREWFAWADGWPARTPAELTARSHGPSARERIEDAMKSVLNGVVETTPVRRDSRWPLPNVWLGVSVENQSAADERIPDLLATLAAVRFLSCEPLLGPVDARMQFDRANDIDWLIAGCESGPGARPADVAWLRSLRDQCRAAGVPFFLKQAKYIDGPRGTRSPISSTPPFADLTQDHGSRLKPGGVIELPYLDGVQHAAMPEVKP